MNEKFPMAELQEFIEKTLNLWHVPGTSIAVVKDGDAILSHGFGLRNLEQKMPVTAETIFPIASCTKAFTAMCIALLVEEGKLEWDKPVRQYLPDFKLHDPHATELMTPRDLLCHRSGLPRHDMMWYGSNFSRREIIRRLQYIEPNCAFRSTWQYQNMMYMVAGFLAGQIAGTTWEDLVQSRIFDVLVMSRSNTSTSITQNDPNHSLPYLYRKGTLTEIPYYEADERGASGPAGSINSCANDMARWLAIHTHGGKVGERSFISPHILEEMHQPHVFIDDPQGRQHLGFEFLSYGLGWSLRSYKGQVLASHKGGTDGFSSIVSFLPRHNLGIIALSNSDATYNDTPSVISYTIYDRLLGLEPTDWNAKCKQVYDEIHQAEDRSKQQSTAQRREALPSHPIEDYLGDYEHPGYGVYSICKSEHGLELVANNKIAMPLQHYHFDVFEANLDRFDMCLKLAFSNDVKGNISGFATQIEPMVMDVFFARLPDHHLTDPTFLTQFTGQYELQGTALAVELTVELKDGKLFVSLPGQQHELIPYQGTEFTLKGLTGFSIAFKQDENEIFHQIILTQPHVVFIANRK